MLQSKIPRLRRELEPRMDRIAEAVAREIAQDWKGDVRVDTGTYRDSIDVKRASEGEWVAGSDDWKAHFQEFGTTKMAAKPSAQRAFDKAKRGSLRRRLKRLTS